MVHPARPPRRRFGGHGPVCAPRIGFRRHRRSVNAVEPVSAVAGVHVWFSWVVIGSNAIAGIWALGAHRRLGLKHRSLWVLTALGSAERVRSGLAGVVAHRQGGPRGPRPSRLVRVRGSGGGRDRLQLPPPPPRTDLPALRLHRAVPDGSRHTGRNPRQRQLSVIRSGRAHLLAPGKRRPPRLLLRRVPAPASACRLMFHWRTAEQAGLRAP